MLCLEKLSDHRLGNRYLLFRVTPDAALAVYVHYLPFNVFGGVLNLTGSATLFSLKWGKWEDGKWKGNME